VLKNDKAKLMKDGLKNHCLSFVYHQFWRSNNGMWISVIPILLLFAYPAISCPPTQREDGNCPGPGL
jgi:hypothetical protein